MNLKYEIFILLKTYQALPLSTDMKLILLLLIQIMAGTNYEEIRN